MPKFRFIFRRWGGELYPTFALSNKDIMKKDSSYQPYKLLLRLIDEGVRERKCENCGRVEWNGKPIPLELHHIDGDTTNNTDSNLQILCPNCHAQTDNYRGRKKKSRI